MGDDPIVLPDDLAALRALALRQHQEIAAKTSLLDAQAEELRVLREYIRLLKHHRFGRSSETSSDAQVRLFNEAEAQGPAEDEGDAAIDVAAHTRRPRGRKPLPAWIPRVEIVHDLAEDAKRCPSDGTALERIGEEISEQLEFIPAKLRVLHHVRPKYACPTCRTGIHTASLPAQPIPKSIASPTLLAHVAVS
jgi:transposase